MKEYKIAVQLRAFRAAAVTILIGLITSCSPEELVVNTCPDGCDAQMVWNYEKDDYPRIGDLAKYSTIHIA